MRLIITMIITDHNKQNDPNVYRKHTYFFHSISKKIQQITIEIL